jgi:hypothetical protein
MDLQPLFWQELSHNKDAMRAYAALSQEGKAAILGRVNKIHSLPSMRLLVASLDEREHLSTISEYE